MARDRITFRPRDTESLIRHYTQLREIIENSDNIIELKFLPFDKELLKLTDKCNNQILLRTKTGRYICLPRDVCGYMKMKDFLGVQFLTIEEFAIMPNIGASWVVPHRDVYEAGL